MYICISVKDSHVILHKQGKKKIGSKSQEKDASFLFISTITFFGALK